jgi:hypothetical protein
MAGGQVGVYHGMRSLVLQTPTASCRRPTRSRPASTTPASGPSTRTCGRPGARATSASATPRRSRPRPCSRAAEGIIPALETAHAIAALPSSSASSAPQAILVVNVSGRGDKDMHTIMSRIDPSALEMVRAAEKDREAVRSALRGPVVVSLPDVPADPPPEHVVIIDGHELVTAPPDVPPDPPPEHVVIIDGHELVTAPPADDKERT